MSVLEQDIKCFCDNNAPLSFIWQDTSILIPTGKEN